MSMLYCPASLWTIAKNMPIRVRSSEIRVGARRYWSFPDSGGGPSSGPLMWRARMGYVRALMAMLLLQLLVSAGRVVGGTYERLEATQTLVSDRIVIMGITNSTNRVATGIRYSLRVFSGFDPFTTYRVDLIKHEQCRSYSWTTPVSMPLTHPFTLLSAHPISRAWEESICLVITPVPIHNWGLLRYLSRHLPVKADIIVTYATNVIEKNNHLLAAYCFLIILGCVLIINIGRWIGMENLMRWKITIMQWTMLATVDIAEKARVLMNDLMIVCAIKKELAMHLMSDWELCGDAAMMSIKSRLMNVLMLAMAAKAGAVVGASMVMMSAKAACSTMAGAVNKKSEKATAALSTVIKREELADSVNTFQMELPQSDTSTVVPDEENEQCAENSDATTKEPLESGHSDQSDDDDGYVQIHASAA